MRSLKDVKVTTLAENLVQTTGLRGQWGFSLLIEALDATGDRRSVLMDTAADVEAFFYNVKKLKTDFSNLDAIVLSHGHYDHTSANVEVVEKCSGVKVYAHPDLFNTHFGVFEDGKRRDIGVPKGQGLAELEAAGAEVVLSSKPEEVIPGLWTTGEVPRRSFEIAIAPPTRFGTVVEGKDRMDQVVDDMSLYAKVDGGKPWVFSGCAHSGLLNILDRVECLSESDEIGALVGGTHLMGRDEKYIERTIDGLRRHGIGLLSPCHCTAFNATKLIWDAFPSSFVLNYSGRVIESGKEPKPRVV